MAQTPDPVPSGDSRTRPWGRWYIPMLMVLAAGAVVAAISDRTIKARVDVATSMDRR
jgi:hypothetical protein